MDKLIELFNEYNLSPEMTGWEPADAWTEEDWNTMSREAKAYIVSKDFWWIKRLVDNDKICNESIDEVVEDCWTDGIWAYYCKCYWVYESLLMLLAISDNSIEFLISILK